SLLKIFNAFLEALRIYFVKLEVRLEKSLVRLLILRVSLLRALCFLVVESDQQAVQDFGSQRVFQLKDVIKLLIVTFREQGNTVADADQVYRHSLPGS